MESVLSLDRFWSKVVEMPSGCWAWTGKPSADGYCRFRLGPLKASAHRLSYEAMVGEIPPGLQLDHLCRNRICVNPYHLDPVTGAVNCARGRLNDRQRAKTHCPRGHEYAGSNLYITPSGARACKACRAAQDYAHRARKQTDR